MLQLLLLFVPVAFLFGWFLGQYGAPRRDYASDSDKRRLLPEHLWGLNYLINERTDQALEMLVKAVELNQETSELHLALGRLFRKRGELDRAIAIHQHLVQYPSLSLFLRAQVELELARDYLSAGVLNQAEQLLRALVKRKELVEDSLVELLHLYHQQRAWKKALATLEYLSKWSGKDWGKALAYTYCELARQVLERNESDKLAFSYIKQALKCYSGSVYARRIAVDFYMLHEQYSKVWKNIKIIIKHDQQFALEMMPLIERCGQHLAQVKRQWLQLLTGGVMKLPFSCYLQQLELLVEHIGVAATLQLLLDQTDNDNLAPAVLHILKLHITNAMPVEIWELTKLQSILIDLGYDRQTVEYRCLNCGFNSRVHFWCCPQCSNWEGLKPYIVDKHK